MTIKLVTAIKRYVGLSTDTKPGAPIGSTFYETDTGSMYILDSAGAWVVKDDHVQLTGSNPYEVHDTTLTLASTTVTLTKAYKYVIVKNLSKLHPILVSLDAAFSATNTLRINPDSTQVFHRASILNVYLKTVVSVASASVIGSDMVPVADNYQPKETKFNIDHIAGYRVLAFGRFVNEMYLTDDAGLNLYSSTDMGVTITLEHTFDLPIANLYITTDNYGLVHTGSILSLDNIGAKLYRTTDWDTWTAVLTTSLPWSGVYNFDENTSNGYLMFGEYSIAAVPIHVWRSIDDGATWTAVLTYYPPLPVDHIHSVQYDSHDNVWWVTTGDSSNECRWLKSPDNGSNWFGVKGAVGEEYKTAGLLFAQDYVLWGTDANGKQCGVYKALKNDLSHKELKLALDHTIMPCIIRSGNTIFVATTVQSTLFSTTNIAELYYSEDLGETWHLLIKWPTLGRNNYAGFFCVTRPDNYGNLYFGTFVDDLIGHTSARNSIRIGTEKGGY